MANPTVTVGFGFQPYGTDGQTPNYRLSTRKILSTNSTAIFKGDAVVPVLATNHGYIERGANTGNTTALAGIFWGCKYLSTSQKRTVWSPYWPGSDATGDVLAYVIDDPQATFKVQNIGTNGFASGTAAAWTVFPVGKLINFAGGASGSTSTGLSAMYVDATTIATTATLPFMIVGMVDSPPGANGADPITNYNQLVVGFNNSMLRSNGAVTGPTFS